MSAKATLAARAALSALSGLALALAFPRFDLAALAWVAFVPLLYAVADLPLRQVFAYAWLQGLVCYVASVYWIVITLHNFAHVHVALAVLPMVLLAAFMAVYTAIAIWAGEFSARRLRLPIFVTLPIAWTALEWLRSFFPIGFPWNLLGYTAYRNLGLIQFAEITGVYGISALIMFFNAVLFVVVFGRYRRRTRVLALGTLTGLMLAAGIFGAVRMRELERMPAQGRMRVAMVQGNIPQSIKWDPNFLPQSFKIYQEQTEAAARNGADLIVWPEAAAAFFFQPDASYPPEFRDDSLYRGQLLDLARKTGDPILFGAPALGVQNGEVGFYNRAYLVSGRGEVVDYYDKIQLVPFGEYVPLKDVLGYFVRRVVTGFGDLFAGSRRTIFTLGGARMGVLICYESVFPDLTRREVDDGVDLLVNITNDAWYGESSAPYQLLAMAAMRAVETKVPMVRVANTGISAVIEPDGEITARTPLFQRGTEIEDVSWRPMRTIYTAVGDLFSEICFALTLAALLTGLLRPRLSQPQTTQNAKLPNANGHRGRRSATN